MFLIRYKLNLNIAATMLIIVWRTDLQEWTGVIIVLCCKSLSTDENSLIQFFVYIIYSFFRLLPATAG